MNEFGEPLIKDGKQVIFKYQLALPEVCNTEFLCALFIMGAGIISIWVTETLATKSKV